MPVYQPGIPTGTVPLNIDYQNLQDNFTQSNNVYTIDHLPFTNATAQLGFHTVVHLLNQSADPVNVPSATAGQIYAKVASIPPGGDHQLFYKTANGGVEQISGSSALQNGFGWFSGILMQWGLSNVNFLGSPTNISFAQTFPNNVFVITIGCINTQGNSPSENNVYVKSGTVTTSGFTVTNSSSGGLPQIYWMAIGN